MWTGSLRVPRMWSTGGKCPGGLSPAWKDTPRDASVHETRISLALGTNCTPLDTETKYHVKCPFTFEGEG